MEAIGDGAEEHVYLDGVDNMSLSETKMRRWRGRRVEHTVTLYNSVRPRPVLPTLSSRAILVCVLELNLGGEDSNVSVICLMAHGM